MDSKQNNIITIDKVDNNQNSSELIPIGRIVCTYAIKGEFIVKPYQTNIEESTLLLAKSLRILAKDARKPPNISNINIIKSKCYKEGILVLSQEFNTPEALKPYIGCEVAIPRDQFPKIDKDNKDEFYWIDLIDKKVVNTQGQELGIVKRMMDNGVQSILCIHPQEDTALSDEILIPFTSTYIIKVEEDIIVDWELD